MLSAFGFIIIAVCVTYLYLVWSQGEALDEIWWGVRYKNKTITPKRNLAEDIRTLATSIVWEETFNHYLENGDVRVKGQMESWGTKVYTWEEDTVLHEPGDYVWAMQKADEAIDKSLRYSYCISHRIEDAAMMLTPCNRLHEPLKYIGPQYDGRMKIPARVEASWLCSWDA